MKRAPSTWALLLLSTGCLYLDDIPTPLVVNEPPEFTSWNPRSTTVVLGANGQTETLFQVFPADPNPEDIPLLAVEWVLELSRSGAEPEERNMGSGNSVRVQREDIVGTTRARLFATVSDPSGEKDYLIWTLEAATP